MSDSITGANFLLKTKKSNDPELQITVTITGQATGVKPGALQALNDLLTSWKTQYGVTATIVGP